MARLFDLGAAYRDFMGGLAKKLSASVLAFHLAVTPTPASRPRFTRQGHTYYGKTYKAFLSDSKKILDVTEFPTTGDPFVVLIEVVSARPKTTKRSFPRGDWDNFGKGPCDVLNERLWADDDQIVAGTVLKRFAEEGEEPGFYITWFTLQEVE